MSTTTTSPPSTAPAAHPAAGPDRCSVLVVGAGPAGSACATLLAQAGLDVVLVDQHDFPRDKICGDGLIPDAHAALRRLGVLDAVLAQAQPASHVRCVGPRGRHVDVPGTLAVLPRRILDDILARRAQACGARLLTPWRLTGPLEREGRVTGARLTCGEQTRTVEADWVVLATGAGVAPLVAAGLCDRRTPSGIALRGYVRNPALAGQHTTLDVVWHRALRPGYGWIFPAGDGVFNIGVGASFRVGADGRGQAADVNLREMFDDFTRIHPAAAAVMDGGTWVGELKGAPLRCTLTGARTGRPGLLATGEAVGSTYDFTGEGIGKAMETGMLAAEALLHGRQDGATDARVLAAYDAALGALRPRFALYERANRVNEFPWLADLVIGRARRSPRLLQRMSGVLNETSNPGNLISFKGLVRLFTA